MLGYGINTFLYSTGAVIAFEVSELIIAVFIGPEAVARVPAGEVRADAARRQLAGVGAGGDDGVLADGVALRG